MWLINAETYVLEDITNPQKGSYAILSHTWEDEEVSFQQYKNMTEAMKLKGFRKIDMTVQLARGRGLKYAWVDTCCIDKSSSAELSEAINSMFKWYSDAAFCVAFLSDLSNSDDLESLSRCRWFYRRWTLQELIAPKIVEFYDKGWTRTGTKETLQWRINSITRIPTEVLLKTVSLREIAIAQRMSWAADRRTTRVEDIAYCLFGLFGINMNPLYGEGENSFVRLQEEILRQSDDATLFAWKAQSNHDQAYRGILAYSPSEFRDCSLIRRLKSADEMSEFRMTNKGLRLEQSDLIHSNDITTILYLHCNRPWRSDSNIGIHLMKTPYGYVRFWPHKLMESYTLHNSPKMNSAVETPVFLAKTIHPEDSAAIAKYSIGFKFKVDYKEVRKIFVWPRTFHNSFEKRGIFYTNFVQQAILIECFEPLGQHDKFFINIWLDSSEFWICLDNLDDVVCAESQVIDVGMLVKMNRHKWLDVERLFSLVNHRSCHHIYETYGRNSKEEVCTSGAFFTCAVKIIAGPEINRSRNGPDPRAVEIKITKRRGNEK